VLQWQDADHEETAPHASTLLIHRLVCSLVGQTQTIQFTRGTKVHHAYGVEEASEELRCNFGLNPVYRARMLSGPLHCTGVDREGEARVVELTSHRFFIATLFLPQLASRPAMPHPLIRAYLRAAVAFHDARNRGKNQRRITT
jgi:CTP synthase (UTP-ammonia lyase)